MESHRLVKKLAIKSDVVLENFKPGSESLTSFQSIQRQAIIIAICDFSPGKMVFRTC